MENTKIAIDANQELFRHKLLFPPLLQQCPQFPLFDSPSTLLIASLCASIAFNSLPLSLLSSFAVLSCKRPCATTATVMLLPHVPHFSSSPCHHLSLSASLQCSCLTSPLPLSLFCSSHVRWRLKPPERNKKVSLVSLSSECTHLGFMSSISYNAFYTGLSPLLSLLTHFVIDVVYIIKCCFFFLFVYVCDTFPLRGTVFCVLLTKIYLTFMLSYHLTPWHTTLPSSLSNAWFLQKKQPLFPLKCLIRW